MRKNEMKFIRTDNEETRTMLIESGYTEITESGSKSFCFLNDGKKLNFSTEDKGIVYTNILCL